MKGPGEITGAAANGVEIAPVAKTSIAIADLSIHDNGDTGVYAPGTGSQSEAPRVRVASSSVSQNVGDGIFAWQARVKTKDGVVSDNGASGVGGVRRIKLVGTTIQNNGLNGVLAPWGTLSAVESTVTFNNSMMTNNADVATRDRPKLVNTVCGFSARFFGGLVHSEQPWGVCGAD